MNNITFNASEVLEMAEQIERNGIKFYRKAAPIFSEQEIRETFLDLAEMEVEHEKTFADMRKNLREGFRESTVYDPENEIALYLQAMANGHVFDPQKDVSKLLTGNETLQEVLEMAIDAEKNSIVFCLGLKNFVPVKAGKDKVEAIIAEEMKHISILNLRMSTLE